jgi:arylsulfatase A-like enzyme
VYFVYFVVSKSNCFEHSAFSKSKFTMKPNRLFIFAAALLPFVSAARADDASLASVFTNAPHAAAAIPRRASIIVIACDGLGCGDLSCYGQTNFQTPNFDRLAAEGTRFTDYRVAGDELPLAQAAFMAGKNAAPAPDEPTLAARLQLAGYHTGLIGEWTLAAPPWTQGFDEFAGFLNEQEAKNYFSDFIWRHAPKSVYDETNKTFSAYTGRETIYENAGGQKNRYLPDMFTSAMVNFVRVNVPDFANHYRPFFLLASLPAPRSATDGKDDFPVPTDAPFTGENWPQAAKNRAALLTRLDEGVGRLLEQLKKINMTNNVAIFLTGAVAPKNFADTNLNFLKLAGEVRGGDSADRLRVPMIVRWPGHVPAGRVSPQPWSAADFAPTALQIAYAKPPASFTGVSMLPALLGAPETNSPAREIKQP